MAVTSDVWLYGTVEAVTADSVTVTHGPGSWGVVVFVDSRLFASTSSDYPDEIPIVPDVPTTPPAGFETKQLVVRLPLIREGERYVHVWIGKRDGYPLAGRMFGPWYVQSAPVSWEPPSV